MRRPHRPLAGRTSDALVRALAHWRQTVSAQEGRKPFYILSNRAIQNIAHTRPETLPALGAIYGLGEGRVAAYGAAILALVADTPTSGPRLAALARPAAPAGRPERPATTEQAARARLAELGISPTGDDAMAWAGHYPEWVDLQAATAEGLTAQMGRALAALRQQEPLSRKNLRYWSGTWATVTDRAIDALITAGKIERDPADAAEQKPDDMLFRRVPQNARKTVKRKS